MIPTAMITVVARVADLQRVRDNLPEYMTRVIDADHHDFCDGEVVGFVNMCPMSTEHCINELREAGLTPSEGEEDSETWKDAAVIEWGEPTLPCEWLECGFFEYDLPHVPSHDGKRASGNFTWLKGGKGPEHYQHKNLRRFAE